MSDNTTTILPNNADNKQVPNLFNNTDTIRDNDKFDKDNHLLYNDFYGDYGGKK